MRRGMGENRSASPAELTLAERPNGKETARGVACDGYGTIRPCWDQKTRVVVPIGKERTAVVLKSARQLLSGGQKNNFWELKRTVHLGWNDAPHRFHAPPGRSVYLDQRRWEATNRTDPDSQARTFVRPGWRFLCTSCTLRPEGTSNK